MIKWRKYSVLFLCCLLSGCATSKDPEQVFKGQSAEQIFAGGEQAMAKHNYDTAVKHFEGLDVIYPFSDYSEQAKLDSMYAYYKTGDYPSTAAAAESYIRLYPASPHVDYAYYMKGVADMIQTRSWSQRYLPVDIATRDETTAKQAFQDFNQLVTLYPNSVYAPDARQRMVYLRNLFAEHSLSIAQFYYDHHSYVAAVNRANEVLQNYQNTPSVEPALVVLYKSYRQLKMDDLAENTLQLLQTNYPESAKKIT